MAKKAIIIAVVGIDYFSVKTSVDFACCLDHIRGKRRVIKNEHLLVRSDSAGSSTVVGLYTVVACL